MYFTIDNYDPQRGLHPWSWIARQVHIHVEYYAKHKRSALKELTNHSDVVTQTVDRSENQITNPQLAQLFVQKLFEKLGTVISYDNDPDGQRTLTAFYEFVVNKRGQDDLAEWIDIGQSTLVERFQMLLRKARTIIREDKALMQMANQLGVGVDDREDMIHLVLRAGDRFLSGTRTVGKLRPKRRRAGN